MQMKHKYKSVSSEQKKVESLPGPSQPAITCSQLTIETLEKGVKYVQI